MFFATGLYAAALGTTLMGLTPGEAFLMALARARSFPLSLAPLHSAPRGVSS